MLTDKTQAAIAALRAVAYCVPRSSPGTSPSVPVRMLRDLEDYGLIRLLPGGNPSSPGSYKLCRSFSSLSLYDLLLAIGEGVFPVSPDTSEEHIHQRFGYVSGASRLGIINHILRTLLDSISLSSLWQITPTPAFMKYKRTLRLFAIFLAYELCAMLFATLVCSCGRDGERGSGAVTACSSAPSVGALNVNLLNNQAIWE